MGMRFLLSLACAGALLGPAGLAAQADSGLAVRTVRFYRAETGQTQVTAFIRIPYGFLEPTGAPGLQPKLAFGLTVRVADSAGGVLYEQTWHKEVHPAAPGRMNGLDMIRFALDSGAYVFTAIVKDAATGLQVRESIPVAAYPRHPRLSDLLLSREIRPVAPGDSIPRPGIVRRGNLLLEAAAMVVVPSTQPVLHYLMESYLDGPAEGTVMLRVEDAMGEVLREVPASGVYVAEGTAVLTGRLDLLGLSPGAYSLAATVQLGTRTFARRAPFWIAQVGEAIGRR